MSSATESRRPTDSLSAGSVHHHGFDRVEMAARFEQAGFREPRSITAHVVRRPIATGDTRDFPVFLLTAQRP